MQMANKNRTRIKQMTHDHSFSPHSLQLRIKN